MSQRCRYFPIIRVPASSLKSALMLILRATHPFYKGWGVAFEGTTSLTLRIFWGLPVAPHFLNFLERRKSHRICELHWLPRVYFHIWGLSPLHQVLQEWTSQARLILWNQPALGLVLYLPTLLLLLYLFLSLTSCSGVHFLPSAWPNFTRFLSCFQAQANTEKNGPGPPYQLLLRICWLQHDPFLSDPIRFPLFVWLPLQTFCLSLLPLLYSVKHTHTQSPFLFDFETVAAFRDQRVPLIATAFLISLPHLSLNVFHTLPALCFALWNGGHRLSFLAHGFLMQEFHETMPVEKRGKRQPFMEIVNFLHYWISIGALSSGLLRESSCTPPAAKLADCFSSQSAGGQLVPEKHLLPVKWLRSPRPFSDKGKPALTEAPCSPWQRSLLVTLDCLPLGWCNAQFSLQPWQRIGQPLGPLHTGLSQRNSHLLVITHGDDHAHHWERSSF